MEQQKSVFTPFVDVEEHERGIDYCSSTTSEASLLNNVQPSKSGEIPVKKSLCRMCNSCFSTDRFRSDAMGLL